jgi:hypothetical protein
VLKQLDTLIGFAVVMSVVSMLIMVATQAISSTLALRGKVLLDALEALFVRIVPDLDSAKARALAEVILKRPTISDSSLSIKGRMPEIWKLATAIRPEECLRAIRKIALSDADILKRVLSKDGAASVENAKDAAARVLAAFDSPEAKRAAESALAAVKEIVPESPALSAVQAKVDALLAHAVGAMQTEAQSWATQFQSAQDRSEQWFTMQARRVTVILAFVTAFFLQLDAFQLFTRLSNDADLRNQLVTLSPNIQKRVDEALNVKFPGTVYLDALKELKNKKEISADPGETDAATGASAREWLVKQAATPDALKDYDVVVQNEAVKRTKDAKEEFTEMVGIYDQTKLRLIPEPYPLALDTSFPYLHDVSSFLGLTGLASGNALLRDVCGGDAANAGRVVLVQPLEKPL